VKIYRGLAAARPDAFLPDLATSLNNQSNRLSELGRREDALLAGAQPPADHPERPLGGVRRRRCRVAARERSAQSRAPRSGIRRLRHHQHISSSSDHAQDFKSRLLEQLVFLDASASAYDNGVESEGIRLAATIRVLVHDGRSPSRSLLGHLEVRDRLPWTDTAAGEVRDSAMSVSSGLCMMAMNLDGSGTSSFRPHH
jgi:hypothetical protein